MQSSSRNGAKVIWLAVHTTEGIMRAWDLRNWTSWAGSSHAANDETGVLLTPADGFVPYDRAAWTLRNGNPISENIEQCGWARWTRAEWLARPKLLDTTARWLAERSKARGIPLVKLSPADVKARKPGVLGHGDYSTGTGDGTHWDPGANYPWDVVLDKARAYANGTPEDDMFNDPDRADLRAIKTAIEWWLVPDDDPATPANEAQPNSKGELGKRIRRTHETIAAQASALTALSKLVAEQNGLTLDDVERVINEAVARGIDIDVTVQPGTPSP